MMLHDHRHDDRWNTVLFFWAGLAPAADVENFVRRCMGQDDWNDVLLAVGLAYDQSEQVPPEIPRELVERMVAMSAGKNYSQLKSREITRVSVTGDESLQWRCVTWNVQGLSNNLMLEIFDQWHEQRLFDWSQVRSSSGYIGYQLWTTCVMAPLDAEEWRQCLRDASLVENMDRFADSAKPESRWWVPFSNVAYRAVHVEKPTPVEVFQGFRHEVPSLARVTSLILLLELVWYFRSHRSNMFDGDFRSHLERYLALWAAYISDDVDDIWLCRTKAIQWDRQMVPKEGTFDLLQQCQADLDDALSKGMLTKTPVVEHILRTIEQLIAKREVLLANQPQVSA